MADTMAELETSRRVQWWQHLVGFFVGIVAAYALSYFTALWVSFSMGFSSGGPSLVAQPITLALTAASAGVIIGVVQSRLLIRAGFITAIAAFLVAGLIASMLTTAPLAWGNTTPLVFGHFLANAGSNPGTVGILVAALVQAVMIHFSRRSKRQSGT